jgi:hypothetical protein
LSFKNVAVQQLNHHRRPIAILTPESTAAIAESRPGQLGGRHSTRRQPATPAARYSDLMNAHRSHRRSGLFRIAGCVMTERTREPEFAGGAQEHLALLAGPGRENAITIGGLTGVPWCPIDKSKSRDLEPLTVCGLRNAGQGKAMWSGSFIDFVRIS